MIQTIINKIENLKAKKDNDRLLNFHKIVKLFDLDVEKFSAIHIGGTNGKGSTVKFLAAILNANHYKVGTFTSPYVEKFNERIQIDGKFISDEDIILIYNKINEKEAAIHKILDRDLGFFEFCFLMSLIYFKKEACDYTIFEVGIGGSKDVTNILKPKVSAVTSVGRDHLDLLGPKLRDVYIQKLGIIKPKTPFLIYKNLWYNHLIKKMLKQNNGVGHILNRPKKQMVFYVDGFLKLKLGKYVYSTNLLGYHQACNLYLSLNIAKTLNLNINPNVINDYLEKIIWPGRFEIIKTSPLIILDGAHNPDAAYSLKKLILDLKLNPLTICYSSSSNKEYKKVIRILKPLAKEFIITSFPYYRSISKTDVLNLGLKYTEFSDVLNCIKSDKGVYLFTGSLFFISEIRKLVKRK